MPSSYTKAVRDHGDNWIQGLREQDCNLNLLHIDCELYDDYMLMLKREQRKQSEASVVAHITAQITDDEIIHILFSAGLTISPYHMRGVRDDYIRFARALIRRTVTTMLNK